ncbi:MAG: DUF3160 domain-containing protein [Patescibacteria group bacterium]
MDQSKDQAAAPAVKSAGIWKNQPSWLKFLVGSLLYSGTIILTFWYFSSPFKPAAVPTPSVNAPDQAVDDLRPIPGIAAAGAFALYEPVVANVKPAGKPYAVSADLGNIPNAGDFYLSDAAKDLLVRNAFVVTPGWTKEFFQLYEKNRYDKLPSFVTVDAVVHNYHLMFDNLLQQLETGKLSAEARALTTRLLRASREQLTGLKGTAWENAAKRNVAFFAVAAKLLNGAAETPAEVRPEVAAELDLIAAHAGIKESPMMNMGAERSSGPPPKLGDAYLEDYSQYVPRGHYEKSELLKSYFRAMMWYGRMNFRFKTADEVRSAALMAAALRADGAALAHWDAIYEPTAFFVGKSDDIGYHEFVKALASAYGADADASALAADEAGFGKLQTALAALEPPQLNSMPIFDETISPDREKEIRGFRLMGQRFTIDASIFQRLIYREVKENPQGARRMLPKGLDIPAALGSEEAYALLRSAGATDFKDYPENMSKLRTYISGLGDEVWTQNLYWGWLYSLRPLVAAKGAGWPSFMTNAAWARKDLESVLGSWTELKHDTILYAKQVYAELGGAGLDERLRDDRGYVQPEPEVYARLLALTAMTKRGLEARGLLDAPSAANLDLMSELLRKLLVISEKELAVLPLSAEDYEFIRSFGGQLEHLWYEINAAEIAAAQASSSSYLDNNPAALVADVATDPNGQVLEEGTGHISNIFVVFPLDGELKLAKGGVYSYYEFPWPMNDRLTDAKWREMLDTGKTPERPDWVKAFTTAN